ncbi:hypothetical protein J437_LFUL015842 [Ladona fulva]|uniref:Uncharacterized protein n=1 Tax=Ladona fulva TaxID=123851 RepID=A0A8K0K458_LADFU|nr:hypothetical protein J437_LFUL015842 [Ladona fulva]
MVRLSRIKSTKPVVYVVEDQRGDDIEGRFYEPKLQCVRGKRRIEGLFKWKGYPDGFNSWMKDQFYITLPSNSSMNSFPDNTTTRFRTQLPLRIELNSEWKVALNRNSLHYITYYKPLSLIIDDSPFVVSSAGDEYIDQGYTLTQVVVKIIRTDGSHIVEEHNFGPVKNFLHPLFLQVDIYLNQKLVLSPSNTYSYRSYIENLLSCTPAAKKSHLTRSLWYDDISRLMYNLDHRNAALAKRRNFTNMSKSIDMIGCIEGWCLDCDRLYIAFPRLLLRP